MPSHMAYNLVLADTSGQTASVELAPGGGVSMMPTSIATNHQGGGAVADRPAFTRTFKRCSPLEQLRITPRRMSRQFLKSPLLQDRYAQGFGTLFTGEYDPKTLTLGLTLNGTRWDEAIHDLPKYSVLLIMRRVAQSERFIILIMHFTREATGLRLHLSIGV